MTRVGCLLALGLVAGLLGAGPRWYVPPTMDTGKANEVYVWGDLETFRVEVRRPGASVPLATAPGVPRGSLEVGGRPVRWAAALVGLEASEVSGPVTVALWDAAGRLVASVDSTIVQGTYTLEDVALNRAMTQLRAQPDPRKDREAEAIWKVYLTFHREGAWPGGRFRLPVDPGFPYSAHYGDTRRYLYSDGTTATDVHRGLDFAVPVGTPVSAPAPGVVALVATRVLTGTTVVVEHAPGVFSIYFHLSRAVVRVGQSVASGALLGVSGATGLVTGPHLHWEVKVNGVSVDPLGFVVDGVLDTRTVADVISSVEQTIP